MRLYRSILLSSMALSALSASAARVSATVAESAVRGFAATAGHLVPGLGSFPREVRGHVASDGSGFYSARMSGGGTVFISGDDDFEPVIAFTSVDVDYERLDPGSPLRMLLDRDQRERRVSSAAGEKWRRLLSAGGSVPVYPSLLSVVRFSEGLSCPGDVRVPALVETQWNQSDAGGSRCYNYYTPGNSVCGCVATAMSQVMRLHRWPDADHPVSADVFACRYDSAVTNLTMQGGVYDWSLMPAGTAGDPIADEAQRREIGRLTSDAGISVEMSYTRSSSAAYGLTAVDSFMDVWHYGQATILYDYADDGYGYIDGVHGDHRRREVLQKVMFSNFDNGCPVMLGISGNGGHCIVADGYGFEGDVDYVHLNMGWSGSYDLWYNLPRIGAGFQFDSVLEVVYNVFPTNGVECAALSGRVLDEGARGIAAAHVTIRRRGTSEVVAEVESSSSGVYGAILPGEAGYDITVVSSDLSMTGTAVNVTLASPVVYEFEDEDTGLYCSRMALPGEEAGNRWGVDIVLKPGVRVTPTNFYVSASSGVDAPDRGTFAAPYATIQYAITNGQLLVDGDVFNVLPGTYYGCVKTPETPVAIVSTDGPEATVIDGEGWYCCYYGGANLENVISGFTITNGAHYGGVFGGVAIGCVIVDCVNTAGDAGYGGGAYGAELHDCVLHNNEAYYGGGAASCTLVNCTVYDNWAYYAGGGVSFDCTVTNSIVWRNRVTNDDLIENWESYGRYRPSFAFSCTFPEGFDDLGGNITNDPLCVSFDIDDWRLRAGSPCAGADSRGMNMGAWQGDPLVGYVITAEVDGRGSVTPWSQFVLVGEDAKFTAVGDHPFLGFATNGVTVSLDREYIWPDVRSDGTLTASFGPTNYCIDVSSGDDGNDGFSWETPLKSIYAMALKAGRGDKVKVGPGVYEGCDWCVYGVEVESTDGASATIVDGGGTNRCVYADRMTYRGFTFVNGCVPHGYGGGVLGGTFVDCVISNCTAAAGGGASDAVMTNCLIVGCDAVKFKDGWRWYGGFGAGAYASGLYNCTLFGNGTDSCSGANDVITDDSSHFRDAANGDFRLKPSSSFVDAGDPACVSVDHDLAGVDRVWGDSVDCGCYEYHLPESVTDPTGIGVAAALEREGYRGEYAAAVTATKDYAYLVEWVRDHGLTASDLNASSTGFISPALNADGLLELDPTNLVLQSFAPSKDNVWNVLLALPGYDGAKINVPLLRAAVGVIGSEILNGLYSTNGLSFSVTPKPTNVELKVSLPESVTNYFLKATVR